MNKDPDDNSQETRAKVEPKAEDISDQAVMSPEAEPATALSGNDVAASSGARSRESGATTMLGAWDRFLRAPERAKRDNVGKR